MSPNAGAESGGKGIQDTVPLGERGDLRVLFGEDSGSSVFDLEVLRSFLGRFVGVKNGDVTGAVFLFSIRLGASLTSTSSTSLTSTESSSADFISLASGLLLGVEFNGDMAGSKPTASVVGCVFLLHNDWPSRVSKARLKMLVDPISLAISC